jgi:hypothetical protein
VKKKLEFIFFLGGSWNGRHAKVVAGGRSAERKNTAGLGHDVYVRSPETTEITVKTVNRAGTKSKSQEAVVFKYAGTK